ncbi:MAG: DUF4249 domain-containing protein [Vicingaceae bacterium]
MKTLKYTFIILSTAILFTSCEKEIDLDLDESEQLFVVEAIVHDNLGDNYVLLTKTRPYNNNGEIEKVSNASVQISDNDGNTFRLNEVAPGFYTSNTLQGIANKTYDLVINAEGKTITASSFLNPRVAIDSLSQKQGEEAFWEDPNIPEYTVRCHFTDPGNKENFYRLKAFSAGVQEDGFLSLEDEFFNGNATYFPIFDSDFFIGDSVTVQLLSIDEVNHRYFTALTASQGGEVPGNPITNLEGDNAVGYFGAYAKSEESIIIVE